MGSLSGRRTILNAGIAVRDLCTEDTGADETQRSDSRKNDHMLVTSPAEWEVPTREVEITIEGDCADYQKQGDKHR